MPKHNIEMLLNKQFSKAEIKQDPCSLCNVKCCDAMCVGHYLLKYSLPFQDQQEQLSFYQSNNASIQMIRDKEKEEIIRTTTVSLPLKNTQTQENRITVEKIEEMVDQQIYLDLITESPSKNDDEDNEITDEEKLREKLRKSMSQEEYTELEMNLDPNSFQNLVIVVLGGYLIFLRNQSIFDIKIARTPFPIRHRRRPIPTLRPQRRSNPINKKPTRRIQLLLPKSR